MEKKLYIETDILENFKCKCGECKRTCCSGWKISICKKEYYKLSTLECSKNLSDKIQSSLVEPDFPTDEVYRLISPNYLGYCPMLDDNGLCMIHKELGPECLSEICRCYPRSYKKVNNVLQATCSNSCEAVVEQLLNIDSLSFKTVEKNNNPNITINIDDDIMALQLMFTNTIKDRSIPLNKRLNKIVNYLNNEDKENYDSFSAYLQVANFVKTVSINSDIYNNFLNILNDRYDLNKDGLKQFKEDEKQFELNYPDWQIYFENILINHFYYSSIPYVDNRIKRKDCTEGICLLYALMKIICSVCTINDHSKENLICTLSDIFHLIEHSSFYYNAHLLINDEASLLNI